SCTFTSAAMLALTPRTRAWARPRVRTGVAEEVPELASLPEGETKNVVWVAADASGTSATAATPSAATATAMPAYRLMFARGGLFGFGGVCGRDTRSPRLSDHWPGARQRRNAPAMAA